MSAVRARAWVAPDETGITYGRLGSPSGHIGVPTGTAVATASFDKIILLSIGGDASVVSLVDPDTYAMTQVAAIVPAFEQDVAAQMTADGRSIFLHASTPGADRGVIKVDIASGEVVEVVAPRAFTLDTTRSWLLRSHSGKTMVSMACDHQRCSLDVISTATSVAKSFEGSLVAYGTTDRYVFGALDRANPPAGYGVLDLETGEIGGLEQGAVIRAHAVAPVSGDRFLVDADQRGRGRVEIIRIDAASREYQVLATSEAPTMRGAADTLFNPVDDALLMLSGAEPKLLGDLLAEGGLVGAFTADGKLVPDVASLAP